MRIALICSLIALAFSRRLTSTSGPREFAAIGPAPGEQVLKLSLALHVPAETRQGLENTLLSLSDPRSATYGQYWSQEQLDSYLSAPESTYQALESYLTSHGVNGPFSRDLHGMLLSFQTTVEVASSLLDTEFEIYCHQTVKNYCMPRTLSYTLDASIESLVDFVSGTTHFPSLDSLRVKPLSAEKSAKYHEAISKRQFEIGWTPRGLQELFSTSGVTPSTTSGNRQAVASFLGQYYDEPDLQEFFTLFYQEGIGSEPSAVIGTQGLLPGVEADLDVQYIMATSDLVDTWVYSNPGLHDGQEPFLTWLALLANTSDASIPKSISVSYGDDESSIETSYLWLCNSAFQALGTRGVSVMFASGDSGASCLKGRFSPGWPATSPWVTAVGGVTGESGSLEGDFISGGGFSNVFPLPDYQATVVPSYIAAAKAAKTLPPQALWNATGRAFPDVAAPSEGFWVVNYLVPTPVSGTSCASPSFTTVISLLNDVQLTAGKPTLGFLNPWLYQNAGNMMQSVTSGCNAGCSANKGTGFCAVEGQLYSPVSGLGVPDYGKMLQYLP